MPQSKSHILEGRMDFNLCKTALQWQSYYCANHNSQNAPGDNVDPRQAHVGRADTFIEASP
eukprot:1870817-Amphidinium_carterae.7